MGGGGFSADGAYGTAAVVLVVAATVLIGALGLRISRTTSDFYVASRTVGPWWNASAVSGEYLSAASFLGIAGLVLSYGADMLWYPVGYTAGYVVLLALVAAPLRRSGAYTLPDFAESRLESRLVRQLATAFVVGIGWLFVLPQLQGAGLTLRTVTGAPVWLGGLLVAGVVAANVAAGGMRSITFVQAFQYWLKLTALGIPVIFLILAWRADGAPAVTGPEPPLFPRQTTVTMQADATIRTAGFVIVTAYGEVDGNLYTGQHLALQGRTHRVARGTRLVFPAGGAVPHVSSIPPVTGHRWALPLSSGREDHPLYVTYALIIATFLGTMGLPHVVVRFYTNPDGRAARRSTIVVVSLLGLFYLLPTVYGALGRLYAPELLLTGNTDAVVLVLPGRMVGGVGGRLLGTLVTAGAFAAFLATCSGLALSVAGVLSQDVLRRPGVAGFRLATLLAIGVPAGLTLLTPRLAVANTVGFAFAVAASSFCPLLVLGIWWRRLTRIGAAVGMVTGGGLALAAVTLTIAGGPARGWPHTLLAWPAAWSVPLAFAVMIVVSLLTPRHRPVGTRRAMIRLHAPENLRLSITHDPDTAPAPDPTPTG
ncbi:MAG: cation acetate symporter [Mycobacteriales bacterium]